MRVFVRWCCKITFFWIFTMCIDSKIEWVLNTTFDKFSELPIQHTLIEITPNNLCSTGCHWLDALHWLRQNRKKNSREKKKLNSWFDDSITISYDVQCVRSCLWPDYIRGMFGMCARSAPQLRPVHLVCASKNTRHNVVSSACISYIISNFFSVVFIIKTIQRIKITLVFSHDSYAVL